MNCCGSHSKHNYGKKNNLSIDKNEKKRSWTAIVIMIIIVLLLILSAFTFH